MTRGRRVASLALFLAASSAISCRGGSDDASRSNRALDFGAGDVEGTVLWNGAALTGNDAADLYFAAPTWTAPVDASGHYLVANLPPGDHVLGLRSLDCGIVIAEQTAAVTATTTTTLDFDLTASMGRITGAVTRGGAPAEAFFTLGGSCYGFPTAPDGTFSKLVPAGTYQTVVQAGPATASVAVTVTAGQVTALAGVDVELGSVRGTVSWNGAPVSYPETTSLNGLISVRMPPGLQEYYDSRGHYATPARSPGNVTVAVYSAPAGYAPSTCVLAQSTVAVPAGGTTVDFDLTPTVGRVTGALAFNGVRSAGWIGLGACGGHYAEAQNDFAFLLPAGTYTATVHEGNGGGYVALGSLPFTVSAGQTIDVGVVDTPAGSVRGTVVWQGAPIGGRAGLAYVRAEAWPAWLNGDGTYATVLLVPGSHALSLYHYACNQTLTQITVDVSAGPPTLADIDITTRMGQLTGSVSLDGVPTFGGAFLSPCGGYWSTDADGQFNPILVPPGDYQIAVSAGNATRTVQTTVVAGQTTNVGNVDVQSTPLGSVHGTVSWKGDPGAALSAVAASVAIEGAMGNGVSAIDGTGGYDVQDLPPGDYTVRVRNRCGGTLAETSLSLAPSAATLLDLDVTPTAGQITGVLTVNGVPLANAQILLDGGGGGGVEFTEPGGEEFLAAGIPCAFQTNASGAIAQFLPIDAYQATVSRGPFVGGFSFGIAAGQVTDVDGATTPPGMNVPLNLSGGIAAIGGISINFSQVLTAGHTTVVESGVGPAAPTGYQILGFTGVPRYWDIDTSAGYTGSITVCVHYDQAWVFGNESMLRLVHDSGSGFANITTSLNVTTNVVCGSTNSLSPFAVVEPTGEDVTGPAFTNLPGTVTAYATSTHGAVVNYKPPTAVDDVDGARPVACTPGPGSQYPPNQTTVTCTASDTRGNASTTSFVVWVTYQAPADGSFFMKPVRANGSSIFRIGRAIPVKFQLGGASKNIADLQARFLVTKISNAVLGTADDEGDEDGEDTDFLFKYRAAKKLYAYRWKTRGETQGTYRLSADLGDGVVHAVNISLKVKR